MTRFWFIWLPLLVLGAQCVMEFTRTSAELAVLMSENGPIELAQWIVITGAFLVSLATLCKVRPVRHPWLFGWVLTAALACLYISGEEVSWGQHFMNWDTPDYWKAVNDQHETNLHNTSSWLDQKPRLILMVGITLGGIIFPLLQKFRPGTLPEKFAIIYPSPKLMVVALLVMGPYLVQEVTEHAADFKIFERVSEVQELYMFYFILLYIVMLRRKVATYP